MTQRQNNEAENMLLDRPVFLVDDEAYQTFAAVLNAPVHDNPAHGALLNSKGPWEK